VPLTSICSRRAGAGSRRQSPGGRGPAGRRPVTRSMPSHGFYVRHVKGIQFDNIEIKAEKEDQRPEFVLDDVQGRTSSASKAPRAWRPGFRPPTTFRISTCTCAPACPIRSWQKSTRRRCEAITQLSDLRRLRRFRGAGPLARGRPPGRPALTQEEPDQRVRRGRGVRPHSVAAMLLCTTIRHFLRAPRRIVGQVFNLRRISIRPRPCTRPPRPWRIANTVCGLLLCGTDDRLLSSVTPDLGHELPSRILNRVRNSL